MWAGATAWLLLAVALLGPKPARLLRLPRPSLELDASTPPNLLLFSVDDNVLDSSWKVAYEDTIAAAGARNPNGCRMPITWFSTCCAHGHTSSDCESVARALAAGHELATHTRTHSKEADGFSYEEWAAEIGGQRDWLVETCGVPASEVAGFRAPYFRTNEVMATVLRDLGFLYDSSLSGRDPTQRQAPSGAALASTMPFKFNISCAMRAADGVAVPGTSRFVRCRRAAPSPREVPAMVLPGSGGQAGRRVDPAPTDDMTVLQRLQADFERKRHSGVPVPLMFHEDYLADGAARGPIVQFLSWATQQPDTWGITYLQYLQYLQAPSGTTIASVLANHTCDRG